MDMTIGNAKWHSDQALGEVRHNKGIKIKKIKVPQRFWKPCNLDCQENTFSY